MFGSDYGNSTPQDSLPVSKLEEEQTNPNTSHTRLWNSLSGSDSVEIRHQKSKGLQLSEDVLNKVYYQNAVKFLKIQ